MRLTASILLLALSLTLIHAQQDPEAKKILDRVSAKMKSYTSIEADFELIIDNRMDDLHSKSTGTVQIMGDKYLMESMGTSVYYNGETMWSHMTDINEVTITSPSKEESDFVENPALIFTFYERDFKYRLVGEVTVDKQEVYEVDLYPKDLNQPYSRFKLFITKENDAIYMVKAISKDAIDYTIYILNSRFNKEFDSSKFTFKPENYPDIEVVDMRF